MCDIVVYHCFEAILRFLKQAGWGCRADHWSEQGAEYEDLEQNIGKMKAV